MTGLAPGTIVAVTTTTAIAILLIGVAALGITLIVVATRQARGRAATVAPAAVRASAWRQQANAACLEASVIVDLATPAAPGNETATTELSSLGQRISQLDDRLARLAREETDPRLAEAQSELKQVARSLGSALDAGRSLRVEASGPGRLEQSAVRISHRTAELDLAVRELSWLVDRPELD